MRKLIIAGFSGSGKSTLCVLLDGHPMLRVSYLMEKFTRVLTDGLAEFASARRGAPPREVIGVPHCRLRLADGQVVPLKMSAFKRFLIKHTYYLTLESEAFAGATASECTNQNIHAIPFRFDFGAFERRWQERLFRQVSEITPEQLIDILYVSMFESFPDLPPPEPDSILTYCIGEEPEAIELFLRQDFDARFIVLTRPLEDLWAVEVDRSIAAGIPRSEAEARLVASRRASSQAALLRKYRHLAAEHQDRIMMLTIDDVVLRYRETMPRIAAFLGIEEAEILYRPTYHGRDEPTLRNYIGKVHDQGRASEFSPRTLALLAHQRDGGSHFALMRRHGLRAALSEIRSGTGRTLRRHLRDRLRRIKQLGLKVTE